MQIVLDPSNENGLRALNRTKGDLSRHVNLAVKEYLKTAKPLCSSNDVPVFEDINLSKLKLVDVDAVPKPVE